MSADQGIDFLNVPPIQCGLIEWGVPTYECYPHSRHTPIFAHMMNAEQLNLKTAHIY